MPITERAPLAIWYEHPHWFGPLFDELDRRGVPHVRLRPDGHHFDPGGCAPPWSLLFNRMSPSAWLRGGADALFYTRDLLDEVEGAGIRVVNGVRAYGVELSKARQLSLLARLGLPFPAARVIHRAEDAPAAAENLRFPVALKPNIGGSGAGVRRFATPEALRAAAEADELELGLDSTALVQEFVPPEAGRIVRVEVLGGRFLYGIRVYTDPESESFDLCPADVCRSADGADLVRSACAVDAPKNGLRVEGYEPPAEIIAQVERIAAEAGIEVGGIEYLVDARDGRHLFYDINALSNFVADAPSVVGFDPFTRLVDWLIEEARA